MKKILTALLTIVFVCTLVTGCSAFLESEQAQSLAVYSFSGENEYFTLSNGVIALTPAEETFYGGNLDVNQEEFNDITAYTMTFYIMSNNEKDVLLSNSVADMTGKTVKLSGETGKRSGGGIIIREQMDALQNQLYFELETTNLDGKKSNYSLQLTLTKVTEG